MKMQSKNRTFEEVHAEIMAMSQTQGGAIGALSVLCGRQSEETFHDALADLLKRRFDVEVLNINEYDESGEVFGRPDQVELDIIIQNGLLLVCELKSSIDKAGMYIFERKVRFYEKRHGRKANRPPMIDDKARRVGEALGIEMFSDSVEMKSLS